MKMKKNMFYGIVIVVVLALIVSAYVGFARPGKYDDFVDCLSAEGATFYGAFWCPHCSDQKKMFGKSAKYLPYVECSTPDRRGQTQICQDEGIEAYPLWKFSDGTEQGGSLTPLQLSQKTGCQLPKNG